MAKKQNKPINCWTEEEKKQKWLLLLHITTHKHLYTDEHTQKKTQKIVEQKKITFDDWNVGKI